MDFSKLISRYRQFGGKRLVFEYFKIGALWPAVMASLRCLVKRLSFKAIYPEILKEVEPYLIERYSPIIQEFKRSKVQEIKGLEHKRCKLVWFCWLQGLENAPEIVHACYNSLKRNLPDREITIIDNENWKEFVDLPDYIIIKWKKRRIPAALFSDLLRLELLIKYGGTWIDSTVLCTGFNDNYLDVDLFLFQYTKLGNIPVSISNWFVTSCANNEVLMVLRDMLYAYWKDYDCTLDYYIFHLFFAMISKEYPEQIKAMPYGQSMNSLVLLHHLDEKFDQRKWDRLSSKVCFHKLAFRVDKEIKNNKENYYNYILSEYGCI